MRFNKPIIIIIILLYIHAYMYIHTYMHTIHTYIHTYIHTIYTIHTYISYIHIHIYHTYTCIHTYTAVCKKFSPWYISVYTYMECIVGRLKKKASLGAKKKNFLNIHVVTRRYSWLHVYPHLVEPFPQCTQHVCLLMYIKGSTAIYIYLGGQYSGQAV